MNSLHRGLMLLTAGEGEVPAELIQEAFRRFILTAVLAVAAVLVWVVFRAGRWGR
jgi:hypothetical protein